MNKSMTETRQFSNVTAIDVLRGYTAAGLPGGGSREYRPRAPCAWGRLTTH